MKTTVFHTYRYILGLAILLMSYSISVQAEAKETIQFPFELIQGLTVIKAEIDGVQGKYLLDTGSDGIFIDGKIDKDSKHSVISLGGTSMTDVAQLKEVRVGDYSQTNLEAQVICLRHIEEHLGIDLKGIIGGYLFQPKVVILDFKNSVITLTDKINKADKSQFENKIKINTHHQIPIVSIQIENQSYQFALDSGSSIHFIDVKLLNKLNDVSRINESSNIKCLVNAESQAKKHCLKSFSLENTQFTNQVFLSRSFENIETATNIALDGILSISQLNQELLIFDYTRSKLYF